ncbi:MAG TPA: histidinol-phosphate transaminase [Pyrinomonadaceae bacterium]|nr:histidinol-phosphate transaminase [Pyrinomonadaceae bacterium]
MRSPAESVKARVRELRPYSLTNESARIKLNQNENPWDAPVSLKEEVFARLGERAWSRYPDFVPAALHERLAAFTGWKPDGIIAGNGSNELIQALLTVTVGEGARVLISEPTFALYRQIATILGGEIVSVPLTSGFQYDLKALRNAIEASDPAVTIICSPNNPTGCVLPARAVAELAEVSRGLVVIDEAYFEFAGETAATLLERHANVVILRTFSKALGLAALRVGYLLAAPELAREISKAVLPYNLNAVSQCAAEVVVERYETHFKPLVGRIVAERERLYEELARIEGLEPIRSRGNFMIAHSAIAPRRVFEELLRRDILARDVSGYPMLKEYFRVSVGAPFENDSLIAALREIYA